MSKEKEKDITLEKAKAYTKELYIYIYNKMNHTIFLFILYNEQNH